MKEIQSRANPLFRQWLKERSHAGRPGHTVWFEGPHLCQAWLQNSLPVRWLIIDQASASDPEIKALCQVVDADVQVFLAAGLFEQLSDVRSHQGVLLMADLPVRELPLSLTASAVILDGVQDPGNVGTILRICAATGVGTVFATAGTAACWSPKVLRSAQGAHSGLEIHEVRTISGWLSQYREQSGRLMVIATTLEQSASLYRTPIPEHAIWVFGSEGQGVSPELLALADQRLRIEHATQHVESLNVATAAALCLFEQRRQHAD